MPPKKKEQDRRSASPQSGGMVEGVVTPFALLLGKQSLEYYMRSNDQKPTSNYRSSSRFQKKTGGNPKSQQNPNQQTEGSYLAQGGKQGSASKKKNM